MKKFFNKILTIVLVVSIVFTVSFLTFDILDMLEVFGEEETTEPPGTPFTYDGGDGFFGNKLVDEVVSEYKLVNYTFENYIDDEYLTVETVGMSIQEFLSYEERRGSDYYLTISIVMPYFPDAYSSVKDGIERERLINELAHTLLYGKVERTLSFAAKRKYRTYVKFITNPTRNYVSVWGYEKKSNYLPIQGFNENTAEGLIALDKYLDTL